ncbi:hypothetical protein MAR_007152 [Mya arenaria]|uniref:B box-type domain-containing protein n=1 Tax=Mya arenaria TaxID=6604 RepID=A0ABY7DAI8_MYAAR|nr:hypothetical protein MAR_007152 [Mya arenaria]
MMTSSMKLQCSSCLRKEDFIGETKPVVKYCIQCNENMCKMCFKDHIKANTSADVKHDYLGPSNVQLGATMCPKHPDNHVDMHCADHHVFTCGACVVLEHSKCENVIDLHEEIQGDKDSATKFASEIEAMKKEIMCLVDLKTKAKSRNRKATAAALACVRNFRQSVEKAFDKLEKSTVDEINSFCLEHDDKIEQEIRKLETQRRVVDLQMSSYLNKPDTNTTNAIDHAVNLYHCRKSLEESSRLCTEVRCSGTTELSQFQISEPLEKYLAGLISLGEFVRTKRNKRQVITIERMHLDLDTQSEIGILSPTALQTGRIVITDSENKEIKIFDESCSVIKTISLFSALEGHKGDSDKLSCEPHAVCRLDDDKIAVSLERDKTIAIIKFTLPAYDVSDVSLVNVDEFCRGIAYNSLFDEIYCCCGGGTFLGEGLGQLMIFTGSGKYLRTVKTEKGVKKPLFACPRDVAVNSIGSQIFVADTVKGILVLDRKGELLRVFTTTELEEPYGVCVDFSDNIYVCGHLSNNVIMLDESMDISDVLVQESDGVLSPQAICVLPWNSKIMIVLNNSLDVMFLSKCKKTA